MSDYIGVLEARIARLESQLKDARLDGACDACCGTGKTLSQKKCMCGGTGRATDAVIHLREEFLKLEDLLDERDQTLLNMGHELGFIDGEDHCDGAVRVADRLRDLEAVVLRARDLLRDGKAANALEALSLVATGFVDKPRSAPAKHGCDWYGYDGEGAQCRATPSCTVDGRRLCEEHGRIIERQDAWKRARACPTCGCDLITVRCPDCNEALWGGHYSEGPTYWKDCNHCGNEINMTLEELAEPALCACGLVTE